MTEKHDMTYDQLMITEKHVLESGRRHAVRTTIRKKMDGHGHRWKWTPENLVRFGEQHPKIRIIAPTIDPIRRRSFGIKI